MLGLNFRSRIWDNLVNVRQGLVKDLVKEGVENELQGIWI